MTEEVEKCSISIPDVIRVRVKVMNHCTSNTHLPGIPPIYMGGTRSLSIISASLFFTLCENKVKTCNYVKTQPNPNT